MDGLMGGWWGLMGIDGGWWGLMGVDGGWWGLMGVDGGWWGLMGVDGGWWGLMRVDGGWWGLMGVDGGWLLIVIVDHSRKFPAKKSSKLDFLECLKQQKTNQQLDSSQEKWRFNMIFHPTINNCGLSNKDVQQSLPWASKHKINQNPPNKAIIILNESEEILPIVNRNIILHKFILYI